MALAIPATATSAFTADVRLFGEWTPLIPKRQTVVRKNPDDTVVPIPTTPEYIWVLPAAQGLLSVIWRFPTMIRQEYHDLLSVILESLDSQQELRSYQVQLRVEQRLVRLCDLETYQNPFELPGNRGLYNAAGALIITGLPGIGKTRFLALLFHLRVAENLPTLYMSDERSATVYKNGQLGYLKNPTSFELLENLPPETWCLVDSSAQFPTVPGAVQHARLFIVHATSPEVSRMEYSRTIEGRRHFCVMGPWTLWELIAGASLQYLPSPPEGKIKVFFERFGGSARKVFRYAHDPESFQADDNTYAMNHKISWIAALTQ